MTVSKIDFQARIEQTCEKIGQGALLQLASPESVRNSDVHNYWRQESLLHWLSGFSEPESAILVLGNKPKGERVHLFLRRKDAFAEMWNGRRLGMEAAEANLEIDKAYDIADLWEQLPKLLDDADKVFYDFGLDDQADLKVVKALSRHRSMKMKNYSGQRLPIHDAYWLAGQLRSCKGPEEVERMRRAAAITAQGFNAVLEQLRPGMNERQIHALLLKTFLDNGADMEAYPSIVAGGSNACILHYIENNAPLDAGELLLIDAGAQFEYYASDVTRTIPIGRQFNKEQKELYQLVLDAEVQAIDMVRLGNSWKDVHNKSVEVLVDGLLSLGLLQGSRDDCIESTVYKKFFPHGTGHWLGMDVHDVGDYYNQGEVVMFKEGMVCTVEPGIYIPEDCQEVPEAYRGIGIRIEDDILVTSDAPEVLTAAIPKTVEQLEGRF